MTVEKTEYIFGIWSSTTLLPISEFVLDEKFKRNASKFAVAFSIFHFVLLYFFA